jgi:thiol:disulfide interchange protein DsbD
MKRDSTALNTTLASHAARLLVTLALLLVALVWPVRATQAAAVVTTDQVRAELLIHAPQGLSPGTPAWLGLKIVHKRGWHTYWLNPGDSGLPTQLQWQLPAGLQAGEIEWPVPHRLPIGPLMNHGYEGTLLLPVPLTVTQALPDAPLTLKLRADWLVCENVCIPEGGDFSLTLPAGAARSALVREAALFDQARAQQAVAWPGLTAQASVGPEGLTLLLKGLPPAWQGQKLAVFPTEAHVLSPSAEPRAQWLAAGWEGVMAYSPQRMEAPKELRFVVTAPGPSGSAQGAPAGVVVNAAVTGAWPATDSAGGSAAAMQGAPGALGASPDIRSGTATGSAPSGETASWLTAALLAVLGGLILNLMPCVFPVLSLKVFGFAADAHNRRALALGGLSYTAGVVLSFVALAALLLALRASGEQLGWGFQLQSPPFVAALALLFTLMALNLLGQFEFGMLVPNRWVTARARNPVIDHFLTGVLAVVVASPCTAPFMGASLGVAITMPTVQALGVFVALGLGMALPYLLLSVMPRWAARLPRPGAWMLRVKHAMALPMLATVVWLLWVLGHQAGVDAAAALLGVLVMAAFAIGAWNWGLQGAAQTTVRGLALAAVLGALAWTWPLLQDGPRDGPASSSAAAANPVAGTGTEARDWAPWSPQALAEELAQGRTVFVDYTAAWCVTCQVNKRSTLRRDEVMQAFRAQGVVTMQADWTRRDEAITRELSRLGRTGVPVYAFYRAGADPMLLPEVLTPALVQQALAQLPR